MPGMALNIERGKVSMLLEDFLKEQGTCEKTTGWAARRVLVFQVVQLMKEYLKLNQWEFIEKSHENHH